MKYEDIITLAKAGYTAEQIFAMDNPHEDNNNLPEDNNIPAEDNNIPAEDSNNPAEDSNNPPENNNYNALTAQIDALSKQVAALTTAQQVANIATKKQPEVQTETPEDIIKFLAVGSDPARRKENK